MTIQFLPTHLLLSQLLLLKLPDFWGYFLCEPKLPVLQLRFNLNLTLPWSYLLLSSNLQKNQQFNLAGKRWDLQVEFMQFAKTVHSRDLLRK